MAARNMELVNACKAFPPHPGPLPLRGGEGERLRIAKNCFIALSAISEISQSLSCCNPLVAEVANCPKRRAISFLADKTGCRSAD